MIVGSLYGIAAMPTNLPLILSEMYRLIFHTWIILGDVLIRGKMDIVPEGCEEGFFLPETSLAPEMGAWDGLFSGLMLVSRIGFLLQNV